MLEKVLKGRPSFYIWLAVLGALISLGGLVYLLQLHMAPRSDRGERSGAHGGRPPPGGRDGSAP